MTDAPWNRDGPHDPDPAPGAPERLPPEVRKRKARWLFARVVIVQVVALAALWLLQATYGSP